MTVKGKAHRDAKKVFLVDDHPVVRRGLADLIEQERGFTVCGEAGSAEEALPAIKTSAPDVVIADLSLKGVDGLELIKNLKIRHPELPILVLSMHEENLYARRAIAAGARGYLMKQEAIPEICGAIRRLLEGKIYLSAGMSEQLLESLSTGGKGARVSPRERLTDRELEVYRLIGNGAATREIARQLHLSVKTVETHRAKIKEKLGLATGAELVRHAVSWAQKL